MTSLQYIVTIFSNPSPDKDRFLYFIPEEKTGLSLLFDNPPLDIVQKVVDGSVDIQKITRAMDNYWNRSSIIHYSGHADSFSLQLEDEKLLADNFIALMGICDSLKLVVLNGCSTQGFVKRLLKATPAKAVIATPRPINDETAKNFSLALYANLLKDIPLETAFTNALSKALLERYRADANIFRVSLDRDEITGIQLLGQRSDNGPRRGFKAEEEVMEDDKGTTWGLYIKDEQVLDWKLSGHIEEARLVDELKEKLLEQKRAWFTAEQRKGKLVEQIERLEQHSDASDLADIIKEKKDELGRVVSSLKTIETEMKQLKNNFQNASDETADEQFISIYVKEIRNLNFTDQYESIAPLERDLPNIASFILHGTPSCCLHQLSRNLLFWLGVHKIDDKVIFDYDSFYAEDDFWEKLRIDLSLITPDNNPEEIVKEIHSRYRDEDGNTRGNFALLFRNGGKDILGDMTMRERLFGFWEKLITLFRRADSGHATCDHSIFLFLVDDKCELLAPSFVSSREDEYKRLASEARFQRVVNAMPTVKAVKAKDILEWQKRSGIPLPYRYLNADLENIFNETAGFLLPTIKEIGSRKIRTQARKSKAFYSFFSSIKTPL